MGQAMLDSGWLSEGHCCCMVPLQEMPCVLFQHICYACPDAEAWNLEWIGGSGLASTSDMCSRASKHGVVMFSTTSRNTLALFSTRYPSVTQVLAHTI